MNHIDVMKQALEVLETSTEWSLTATGNQGKAVQAILALHKAIEEAEKVEPSLKVINGEICYKSSHDDQSFGMRCPVGTWCPVNYDSEHGFAEGIKFYTAPPQREWVGLTDDELPELKAIHDVIMCIGCVKEAPASDPYTLRAVKQMALRINILEAKLKEKNHIADAGKKVGDNT